MNKSTTSRDGRVKTCLYVIISIITLSWIHEHVRYLALVAKALIDIRDVACEGLDGY